MQSLAAAVLALVLGAAAALAIVAVSILPFLNPVWVGFGQTRAQADAWTGYTPEQLRSVTDAILSDLIIGPPRFDVAIDGAAVLQPRERQHMVDVRTVFASFYVVAGVAVVVLAVAFLAARGRDARRWLWRVLSRTGVVVATVTVVGGVLGLLFFDQAFELFHTLFFPAGSYDFDPRTDKLVQLFPERFWTETTIGVGIVIVAISLLLAWVGRRHAAAPAGAVA